MKRSPPRATGKPPDFEIREKASVQASIALCKSRGEDWRSPRSTRAEGSGVLRTRPEITSTRAPDSEAWRS